MRRKHCFNILHRCGKLSAQYVCDMSAKIDTCTLNYLRFNQRQLRTEKYTALKEYQSLQIANNINKKVVGRRIVLPASFSKSPRAEIVKYQNLLRIAAVKGKPDFFITMTSNSDWIEVQREAYPGQSKNLAWLVTDRVFEIKRRLLLEIILNGALGTYVYHGQSVEFQKRGPPHTHTVLRVKETIVQPQDIDKWICAEIPDPEKEPRLHKLVVKFMLHNKCDFPGSRAVCLDDEGKCTKFFPKEFRNETEWSLDGYPLYRRRSPANGGFTAKKGNIVFDNRFVFVPLQVQ